jgi:hypothetical protein
LTLFKLSLAGGIDVQQKWVKRGRGGREW